MYVSKDHAGAAEDALFERDVVVNADIILHFAEVTNGDLVADEYVLAEGYTFADFCATTHMDKVPYAGVFTDFCALVDDGAWVDGVCHGLAQAGNEWMNFALLAINQLGGTDDVDGFDTVARVGQAITTTREDFAVAGGVQIGEAFAEFELFAADVDVTVGSFFSLHFVGQVVGVDRQEPAHAGAFVFQIACCFLGAGVVHDVALEIAKDEVQHVVKVHAYVGGHAKGFAVIAFPAFHVPLATAGDVSQFDIKLGVFGGCGDFVAQLEDGIVVTQLKDVVHAFAGFLLNQRQFIQELRCGHEGFFANNIATQAKACSNMRVVQVVG